MYSGRIGRTLDFLLRQAIHAVLTQRLFEAGPLSDFVA